MRRDAGVTVDDPGLIEPFVSRAVDNSITVWVIFLMLTCAGMIPPDVARMALDSKKPRLLQLLLYNMDVWRVIYISNYRSLEVPWVDDIIINSLAYKWEMGNYASK